mmetsp:Transcript_33944/g.72358  ORF Transcript_33944/g.72358 Transcript_33944/m.72358 type:complete len:552 (+) Transcript_33944:99-1754(+)
MLDFLANVDLATVQHILGPVGVILSCLLAWSPVEAVMQARSAGNLGGLDSKNWPLFFFSNLVWTLRSLEIGDLWVFLSCIMPLALWLWFSLIATKLLSQEEGELMPRFTRDGWNQHWLELSEDYQAFHLASSAQRKKALERLESRLVWGIVSSMILAFVFRPETIVGLEFVDGYVAPSTRGLIFAYICAASTTACWLAPMNRLRRSLKKRDASSIFVPLVLAQVVLTGVWLAYGLLLNDPSLSVSNGIGVVCASLQLLAAGIYNNKGKVEQETLSEYKPPLITITGDEEAPTQPKTCEPSNQDVQGLGGEASFVSLAPSPRRGFLSNSNSNASLASLGNSNRNNNSNSNNNNNSNSNNNDKDKEAANGGLGRFAGADCTTTSWGPFSDMLQSGGDDTTAPNRRPFSPNLRGERFSEPLLFGDFLAAQQQQQQQQDDSRSASRSPVPNSRRPSASPTLAAGCGHYQDYLKWQKDYVEWKQRSERSEALPDLADRLRRCGVFEEYVRWQSDYQKWRAGSSSGAHGELDHLKGSGSLGGTTSRAEEPMSMSKST